MADPAPALFLDRDGVINVDKGYVSQIEDLEWVEGAGPCIANFKRRGWYVFIVTNQSGIAMGYYSEADMDVLHAHMLEVLSRAGARVDRIYHCPFHEDGTVPRYRRNSFDRKPKPGMLLRAMAEFPVQREASLMIGDKQADLEAAQAAGVSGFLFRDGDLAAFAEWALATVQAGGR